MTISEFDEMKFYHGIKVKYNGNGKVYPVEAVDFQEKLIAIQECEQEDADVDWKRCENCELVND